MDRYTIYCTPEQTKKALELGAPITTKRVIQGYEVDIPNSPKIPTAEQMIGWLEEQGLIVTFDKGLVSEWHAYVQRDKEIVFLENELHSRKEATLAAIDNALEYLSNLPKSK